MLPKVKLLGSIGTGVPSGVVRVVFCRTGMNASGVAARGAPAKAAQFVVAARVEAGERGSNISAETLDIRSLHANGKNVPSIRIAMKTRHRHVVFVLHHRAEIPDVPEQAGNLERSVDIRSEAGLEDGWTRLVVAIAERNRAGVNAFQCIRS